MTEKIKDILFRPKQLRKFKQSKLYKAFLYLFIIAFFSSIIQMLDTVKFDGFDVYDQQTFEQASGFDFKVANKLPDCTITEYKLNCDEVVDPISFSIGQLEGAIIPIQYKLVIDPDDTFAVADNELYITFKEEELVLNLGLSSYSFKYESYPSVFKSLDFNEIRESNSPDEELFLVLIGVVNEMYRSNKVVLDSIMISLIYSISYVITVLRVLFYSFILFIFLIPFKVKYIDVFKVTAYAITFGTILSLILNLFGLESWSSFTMMLITFIYVTRALRTIPTVKKQS